MEDGDPYWALRDHKDDFTELFAQLGFSLRYHSRDFFYFDGDDLSEAGERMAVFMFVLVEHLSDDGLSVEQGLMERDWLIAQLPHFKSDRYRELMRAVGVTDERVLRGVVQALDRCGFAVLSESDTFRFRRPVHRFLDLCLDVARSLDEGGA